MGNFTYCGGVLQPIPSEKWLRLVRIGVVLPMGSEAGL